MGKVSPKLNQVPGYVRPTVELGERQIRLGRIGREYTVITLQGSAAARKWAIKALSGGEPDPSIIDDFTIGNTVYLVVNAHIWAPNTVFDHLHDLWIERGGTVTGAGVPDREPDPGEALYTDAEMADALDIPLAKLRQELERPNRILTYTAYDQGNLSSYTVRGKRLEIDTSYTFDQQTYDANLAAWEKWGR